MGPVGRQLHPPPLQSGKPPTNPMATEPLLRHRPAAERFLSRRDWLESWHSFSFGGHDDPAWRGFGPLRVINDDRIAPGRGFDVHPHRDMDIITVLVEGQLEHQDSLGSRGLLQAGDVQCMTAGTGIHHSEINSGERPCRLLQIWLEPAALNLPPAYDQRSISVGPSWTPLIEPQPRERALAVSRPIRVWRARPGAGQILPLPLTVPSLGWIQVIEGQLALGGQQSDAASVLITPEAAIPGPGLPTILGQGDGLGFAAGDLQAVQAIDRPADLLLFQLA